MPKGKKEKPLTDQEERFCVGVAMMNLTDTDAVNYAGFTVAQPWNKAWQLKRRSDIAARIEQLRGKAPTKAEEKHLPIPVTDDSDSFEPASADWVRTKMVKTFRLAESTNQTKEMLAVLKEIGQIIGLYKQQVEVTHKQDPLSALSGPEIVALRQYIASRIAAPQPVITVEATVVETVPASEGDADA
jgi:hypothetical protein